VHKALYDAELQAIANPEQTKEPEKVDDADVRISKHYCCFRTQRLLKSRLTTTTRCDTTL